VWLMVASDGTTASQEHHIATFHHVVPRQPFALTLSVAKNIFFTLSLLDI
jgi:hypothetical protein